MKRLPKYTPAEVRNDPYGFTYKEMSEVIGENEAKALYEELYKQLPRKKKSINVGKKYLQKAVILKSMFTNEKKTKTIETVFLQGGGGGILFWGPQRSVVLVVVFW